MTAHLVMIESLSIPGILLNHVSYPEPYDALLEALTTSSGICPQLPLT